MNRSAIPKQFYNEAKGNKWLSYFITFCRVVLALGFMPSGYVKITVERFASGLSVNHPLGIMPYNRHIYQ